MGRGIIYCGECGKRLLEDDLKAGRGGLLENIPYCSDCRPGIAKPPSNTIESLTVTTARLRAPQTPRPLPPVRPAPQARRSPAAALAIGGAAAGAAVLVAAAFLAGGGSPSRTPTAVAPHAPAPRPPRPAAAPAPKEDLVAALEAFARTEADPKRILLRCDEVRAGTKDPVSLGRIAAVEQAALEAARAGDAARRVEASLEDVRKMMATDRGFAREAEIVRLLDAVAAVAGPRKAAVEALRAEYADHLVLGRLAAAKEIRESEGWMEREAEAAALLEAAAARGGPHRPRVEAEAAAFARRRWEGRRERARRLLEGAPDPERLRESRALLAAAMEIPGAPREALSAERETLEAAYREALLKQVRGPFELDSEGYVRHWLVLGQFPNDAEQHRGFETDHLDGEAAHIFAEGIQVAPESGPVRTWRRITTDESRVNFEDVFGKRDWVVTYAACLLETEADQDLEIRLGSDDGFKLWVDGVHVGSEHAHRGNDPDSNRFPVRLKKGRRRLLIKVEQGDGGHEFMLRLVRPDGSRPSGIKAWH